MRARAGAIVLWLALAQAMPAAVKRVILFKFDGVNADLLDKWMGERDPRTGRSKLPWMQAVFVRDGARLTNFYTRGITLSAPSWSELDTGRHEVIRGNVEYDRWTLQPYDYLNFFPFYFNYSRRTQVDMPGVEVLDDAGIPLLLDAFPPVERWQSYQLYQRGNNWGILEKTLPNHFRGRTPQQLFDEYETGLQLETGVTQETERQLIEALADDQVAYLDFFSGDYDHVAHLTNDPDSQLRALQGMDAAVGRIWTAAHADKLGAETVFAVVSDHGMNTSPSVLSQGWSFVHWFGSAAGGGHHVITDRYPLSTFKIRGLDPFVHKVTTPGSEPTYLKGESDKYPTVTLDVDGNERAAAQLRSNEWNIVHILLEEANRGDLGAPVKAAARAELRRWAEARSSQWAAERAEMNREWDALDRSIARLGTDIAGEKTEAKAAGIETAHDLDLRRRNVLVTRLRDEERDEKGFGKAMDGLVAMPINAKPDRMPQQTLGDANTLYGLQHYVVGLGAAGLVLDASGRLDLERSFRRIDYFEALASIRTRNQVQKGIGNRPVDFIARRLDTTAAEAAFQEAKIEAAVWLYSNADRQAVVLYRESGDGTMEIRYLPVSNLRADRDNVLRWEAAPWTAGLPLALCEGENHPEEEWLGGWHREREWFDAVVNTRYTNGIIGLSELFRPLELFSPEWTKGLPAQDRVLILQWETKRRERVQPDFEIFASDHWNFNVRNFNPGGNHGSFLRQSSHSVLMFSGAGVTAGSTITRPYDSLSLTPTLLRMLGRQPGGAPLPGLPIPVLVPALK